MSQVELSRSHTAAGVDLQGDKQASRGVERAGDARVELTGFSIPDRPFGIHRHVHLVHPLSP